MTYRGHKVLTTLIRAYFSPLHTTAQRFIYAGSADGAVYIYGKAMHLYMQQHCTAITRWCDTIIFGTARMTSNYHKCDEHHNICIVG